jgi:hypothetical protein
VNVSATGSGSNTIGAAWLADIYLRWVTWAAVLGGIALRFRDWMHNPSLWLDELAVTRSITDRNFGQLTHPLLGGQAAAVGWLWSERTLILAFGVNERSLRVVPLLASVIGLIAFPFLARSTTGKWVAPLATVLFAVSPYPIYFATDAKQYSSDATSVILILLCTVIVMKRGVKWAPLWGLACAVLAWFSFPAIAVAAACGVLLALVCLRSLWSLLMLALGGAVLATATALEYVVTLRQLAKDKTLVTYWTALDGYPPRRASLSDYLGWLHRAGLGAMSNPGELRHPVVVLIVSLFGLVYTAWHRLDTALLLAIPIVVGIALAATHRYPFADRLAIYAIPSLLIFLAAGITGLVSMGIECLPTREINKALCVVAGLGLIAVTAGYSLTTGADKAVHPDEIESNREAMQFIVAHRRTGDLVYVNVGAVSALQFYGPKYNIVANGLFTVATTICPDPFKPLAHHRVWLYLGHRASDEPIDRTQELLTHFEQHAVLLRSHTGLGGAGAYLLNFAQPPTRTPIPLPLWIRGGCLSVKPERVP